MPVRSRPTAVACPALWRSRESAPRAAPPIASFELPYSLLTRPRLSSPPSNAFLPRCPGAFSSRSLSRRCSRRAHTHTHARTHMLGSTALGYNLANGTDTSCLPGSTSPSHSTTPSLPHPPAHQEHQHDMRVRQPGLCPRMPALPGNTRAIRANTQLFITNQRSQPPRFCCPESICFPSSVRTR